MTDLSPTQRRVLEAACRQPKPGLVVEDPEADGIVYIVSDAGRAAIGTPAPEQPARNSKKDIIIALLRSGATLAQIMDATGWQKHSVHGALANLKTKDGIVIASTKVDGGERIHKIA